MECPKCGSPNVTDSHRRGIEKLLFFYPKSPYRCKECWTRFWKAKSSLKITKIIVALLVVSATAAMAYFAFTMFWDSDPSPESGDDKGAPHAITPTSTVQFVTTTLARNVTEENPDQAGQRNEENAKAPPRRQTGITGKTEKISSGGKRGDTAKSPGTVKKPIKKLPAVPKTVKRPGKFSAKQSSRIRISPKISKGMFVLYIKTGKPVWEYTHFEMNPPPKVVIDITGKWNYPGAPTLNVRSDMVRRVRIGEHADKLRLVLDLKGKKTIIPIIEATSGGLAITIKK